jgi:hypothetical protein
VWGCGGVGGVGCVGCVGGVGVPPTPYVRHSPDCTCCDFGHLRFYNSIFYFILKWTKIGQKIHCGLVTSLQNSAHSQLDLQIVRPVRVT